MQKLIPTALVTTAATIITVGGAFVAIHCLRAP